MSLYLSDSVLVHKSENGWLEEHLASFSSDLKQKEGNSTVQLKYLQCVQPVAVSQINSASTVMQNDIM